MPFALFGSPSIAPRRCQQCKVLFSCFGRGYCREVAGLMEALKRDIA